MFDIVNNTSVCEVKGCNGSRSPVTLRSGLLDIMDTVKQTYLLMLLNICSFVQN